MRGEMQDYRKHVGREVSVMTYSGSFIGELVGVGNSTLEVKCSGFYDEQGQQGPVPAGIVLLDRLAIAFVQVR